VKVGDYKSRRAFVFDARFPGLGHFDGAYLIEILTEYIQRFGGLLFLSGSWILECKDIPG